MYVIACIFRRDNGQCRLDGKPCDGCKDAPHFINWETEEGEKQ